ncbi:hypothetical protein Tco_0118589 [Tanacetum coccineum]
MSPGKIPSPVLLFLVVHTQTPILIKKNNNYFNGSCYRSDTINNSRGGRVGGALQDMGTVQDPGPILVCSRNDDLDVVLNSTPQSRWSEATEALTSLACVSRQLLSKLLPCTWPYRCNI